MIDDLNPTHQAILTALDGFAARTKEELKQTIGRGETVTIEALAHLVKAGLIERFGDRNKYIRLVRQPEVAPTKTASGRVELAGELLEIEETLEAAGRRRAEILELLGT